MESKRKIFFFWCDGMAETNQSVTSMSLAQTPNIDRLVCKSHLGFYMPIVVPGQSSPKTDIVIPYMCFADPSNFVGRSALELVDSGKPPMNDSWLVSFKITRPIQGDSDASKVDLLKELNLKGGFNVILSPYSEHKNLFVIECSTKNEIDLAWQFITNSLDSKKFTLSQPEINHFKFPEIASQRRVCFAGWSRGSLRGSFRLMGAKVNEYAPPLFDFQSYRNDMKNIKANTLSTMIDQHDVIVFFIKETDTASHLGRQDLKIKSITTLDWVLGQTQPYIPVNSLIVILTDHPTNIGSPSSELAPTPYMIVEWNGHVFPPNHHFCEDTVSKLTNQNNVLSISALRNIIYEY